MYRECFLCDGSRRIILKRNIKYRKDIELLGFRHCYCRYTYLKHNNITLTEEDIKEARGERLIRQKGESTDPLTELFNDFNDIFSPGHK